MHAIKQMTRGTSPIQVTLVALLLTVVLVGGTVFARSVMVGNMASNDKLPRYVGCQAFYRGETPYSQTVRDEIAVMVGDAMHAPSIFAYPAHLCVVAAPFWLLPYETSVGLWMWLNVLLFFAVPLLFIRGVLGGRLQTWQMIAIGFTVLFGLRYVMMTVVLAQYTGWVLFCMVGAIWALADRREIPAAVLLAGMTIRPDGVLLALLLVALAFYAGRRRVLLAWVGIMALLWLVTSLVVPGWERQFVDEVLGYRSRSGFWLPRALGGLGALVIVPALAAWALVLLARLRHLAEREFVVWGSVVLVAFGLLLIPHTNPYTLVYGLPIYALLLHHTRRRPPWFLLVLATMLMSWGLFLLGLDWFGSEQLFFPLALALMLTLAVADRLRQGEKAPVLAHE